MAPQKQSSCSDKDLLTGPCPEITVSPIDFVKENLREYKDSYAVILDNVLTVEECASLVAAAEASHGPWERALINIGGGRQALYSDTRNCGRIIWDSFEIADRVWKRCEPHLQDILVLKNRPHVTGLGPIRRNEVWQATRLNERMRFLKYVGGEFFRAHCDGTYETPDASERSYFTLHLYLSDETSDAKKPLKGGATTFFSGSMREQYDVAPKAGSVLVFQHRNLLHSGEDVLEGTKYTMRTDIMYKKATPAAD